VLQQQLDLASMARKPTSEETSAGMAFVALGTDRIVLATSLDVSIKSLTGQQAKDILTGKITNWSAVGGPDATINVLVREETESATQILRDKLVGKDAFVGGALVLTSAGDMNAALAKTTNALGFLSYTSIFVDQAKARPLAIDGHAPADLNDSSYPFTRQIGVGICRPTPKSSLSSTISPVPKSRLCWPRRVLLPPSERAAVRGNRMSKQGSSSFIGRQLGNLPLSVKLLFLALGPLALTLAVTLALIIVSLNRLENRTSTARLQEEVRIVNQQVAHLEVTLDDLANTLAADPALLDAVQRGDQTALQPILLSANVRSDLSHLQAVNLQGQTLALAQSFVMGKAPAQLERLHSLGLLGIQAVELIPTSQGWLLTVVRPVKTREELVGALTVGRLVDATILSEWNFGRTDPLLTIYDAQGALQSFSGTGEPGQPARPAVNQTFWAQAQSGQEVSGYTQIEGRQYRIAYAPLKVAGKRQRCTAWRS